MKKHGFPFTNMGIISIFVIFVLICILTFATLTRVMVERENNFLKKEMTRKESYQTASNLAQQKIAQIDYELKMAWQDGRYAEMEEIYTFQVPINDDFHLSVEMKTCDPDTHDGRFYILTKYKEEMVREWRDQDQVNLVQIEE